MTAVFVAITPIMAVMASDTLSRDGFESAEEAWAFSEGRASLPERSQALIHRKIYPVGPRLLVSGWAFDSAVLDAAEESLRGVAGLTPYTAARLLADFLDPFPGPRRARFVTLGEQGGQLTAFLGTGFDDEAPDLRAIPYRLIRVPAGTKQRPSYAVSPEPPEGFVEELFAQGLPLWEVAARTIQELSRAHPRGINDAPDVWTVSLMASARPVDPAKVARYWPDELLPVLMNLRQPWELWGDDWWSSHVGAVVAEREELLRQVEGG